MLRVQPGARRRAWSVQTRSWYAALLHTCELLGGPSPSKHRVRIYKAVKRGRGGRSCRMSRVECE